MSTSQADIILLGQSIEHKIAARDLKGTDEAITQALTILRTEFMRFLNNKP
jgi:hypothetical protein